MEDERSKSSSDKLNAPEINWSWENAAYMPQWHEPILELLTRYVPRNAKVLEVGAGGSYSLGALANRLRCAAYGIEPDIAGIRKTIELARNESTEVSMIRGDGFLLPFDRDSFDVVYSLGLVEHFALDQMRMLIAEHFRVCKSGGIVIVAVPNLLNLPHTLRKAYLGADYEYAPERGFTPGHLKKILVSAGLQSVTLDGVHPLWGLGMSPLGWNIVRVLKRIGVASVLDGLKSPRLRAGIGFMTYAIGSKKGSVTK